jgi:hypothetical protein
LGITSRASKLPLPSVAWMEMLVIGLAPLACRLVAAI